MKNRKDSGTVQNNSSELKEIAKIPDPCLLPFPLASPDRGPRLFTRNFLGFDTVPTCEMRNSTPPRDAASWEKPACEAWQLFAAAAGAEMRSRNRRSPENIFKGVTEESAEEDQRFAGPASKDTIE